MTQLQSPQKASEMESFQQEVVSSYFKLISQEELFAREENQGRWDASSIFSEKEIHNVLKTSNMPCLNFPTMLHVLKLVDLYG